MPRDGSGIFSPPAGTTATSGTTIESAKYNAFVSDLTTDANTARPIVAGGTGATTAGAALSNLGGQPSDPALTSIASLSWVADRYPYATGVDTFALGTITAAGRAILDDANAAAQLTTLGIGGDIPVIEALSGTGLPARTGADTWTLRTITAGNGIAVANGDGVGGNPTISASSWTYTSPITLSGTSVDLSTTIPAGVTEVRVFLNLTSLSGSDHYGFQLGTSGGPVTSGYTAQSGTTDSAAVASLTSSTQFILFAGGAADQVTGFVMLMKGDGNDWFFSASVGRGANKTSYGGGVVSLGGVLTQLRIKSTGANTFDTGSAFLAYR